MRSSWFMKRLPRRERAGAGKHIYYNRKYTIVHIDEEIIMELVEKYICIRGENMIKWI